MHADHNPELLNITVAVTGASGSVFARELLRILESDSRVGTVNLVCSENSLRVIAEELGFSGRNNLVQQLLGAETRKIHLQSNDNIGANIASGSYRVDAMIVLPCSMGTLARIANVCLKERIRLVLCVRETPLNKIHLRNMTNAADAGATIYPLIPTFYNRPASLDEMAREFANRVLKHIGLPQAGAYEWNG
jgi:flavin prenyltransferase